MNRIAVQTAGPDAYLGLPETYRKIREWGFDAADAGLDHLLPYADIRAGKIPDILVRGGKDCMELFRPWADGASAAPFRGLARMQGGRLEVHDGGEWRPCVREISPEEVEEVTGT